MRSIPILAASRRLWRLEGLKAWSLIFALGALFVVGLALRLTWVFYTDTIPLGGDPHWYYVVAINLAEGFGFVSNSGSSLLGEAVGPGEPTAFWPPAYSFVLAGFWKVLGIDAASDGGLPSDASLTSAKVLNAVLGALAIPFVYALGRRIFDRRVGLFAAGLFAIFPNAIAWTPLLFPEQLFVLLFVAALWVLVAFPTTSGRAWVPLVTFGVLVSLATLTRGQGAVLVPIAVLYWLMRAGWRPALRQTGLVLLAMVVVIAPWTIRNWVVMGSPIPIASNGGVTLRIGHAPDATGTTMWPGDAVGGVESWQSLYRPEWEVRSYRVYTQRALAYALTHPRRELALSGSKVYHLYRSDSGVIPWLTTLGSTPIRPQAVEHALEPLFDYAYYALLFVALASVPFWLRRRPDRLLLVNVVLLWTLIHIVFQGEPRYHVPLYPVFSIAAAAGVWLAVERSFALWGRWRSGGRPDSGGAA